MVVATVVMLTGVPHSDRSISVHIVPTLKKTCVDPLLYICNTTAPTYINISINKKNGWFAILEEWE